jgi:hypothetical protein
VPLAELSEDLSVPYVLVVYAVPGDGDWMGHAEYPELPNCAVESLNMLSALEQLETLRVRTIIAMRSRGEQPPRPRPPLKSGLAMIAEIDVDALLAEELAMSDGPDAPFSEST